MILKKRIQDILSPRVIGVTPQTPVSEAIRLLRREQISCVVVLEGFKPQGIFTERDILRSVSRLDNGFMDRAISEFMSAPLITATKDIYVYEAYNLLASNNLRHLVIVDGDGQACGVVTESDLVNHLGLEYFIEIKKIFQVMTRMVFTAGKETLLGEVIDKMASKSISCVIVEEAGRPLGIVTERDIARLVLEHEDIKSVSLESVMTSPVLVAEMSSTVHDAAQTMRDKGIRRLVVVDEQGEIEGVITQTDIILGLESRYVEILKEVIREKDVQLRKTVENLFEKTVYLDNILSSSIDMGILATNAELDINYANPTACDILQTTDKEAEGLLLPDLFKSAGLDPLLVKSTIEAISLDGTRQTFHFGKRIKGESRYIRVVVSGIQDNQARLIGYVFMLRDVTEQRKAEETIRYMAYHDILTGLPNRALFADRLNMEMARAVRYAKNIAVMVLDLNDFKKVNDTMGHAAGDLLLKAVGRLLEGLFRKSDTVARMGGDEFFVLLADITTPESALTAGEKVAEALLEPLVVDGHTISISASIGIAIYPHHGEDAESLIRNADKAMYTAKEKNRSRRGECVYMMPISS